MVTPITSGREDTNMPQFFNVFAEGLKIIFDCYVRGEEKTAKKIIISTILYADSQIEEWKTDQKYKIRTIDKDTGEAKVLKITLPALEEMTTEELIYAMGTKEKEAGIAPVQSTASGSVYEYLQKTGKIRK